MIDTGAVLIGYEDHGPPDGEPVILLHGFPYDPRAYDDIWPGLVADGNRVIIPYLRGFGPTRLRAGAMRTGQQAALADDLRALMDGLSLAHATLAGFDWGGRAACIAAALWPDRVRGLVTANGYNIQNIACAHIPAPPEAEHRLWYQYYFHSARGEAGLAANRAALCRLLWRLWSPEWQFDDDIFAHSAASFNNPDFVDIVLHSYRHRFAYTPGDPALDDIEHALAAQPVITVPTISLCGLADGLGTPATPDPDAVKFTGAYARRLLPGIGHNIPQEAPGETLAALRALLAASPGAYSSA
ncbi:MAG: alpha/beta hydrolase [Acidocella sp.]|nr:alpha/beta hydrolase [Acidocella sp.]